MLTHPFLSGGFGNYLLAMSERIAGQATEANNSQNIKNPHLGWIIGFLFLVSFIGLFGLVPLRKVELIYVPLFFFKQWCWYHFNQINTVQIMIIDYKLTYPSGTATAYLINGFHTPHGAKLAGWVLQPCSFLFLTDMRWEVYCYLHHFLQEASKETRYILSSQLLLGFLPVVLHSYR